MPSPLLVLRRAFAAAVLVSVAALAPGCGGDPEVGADSILGISSLPLAASGDYNFNDAVKHKQGRRAQGAIPLRDASGNPLVKNGVVQTISNVPDLTQEGGNLCPGSSCIGVWGIDSFKGTGADGTARTLYFTWGANTGSPSGLVWWGDLDSPPTIYGETGGNGKAAPLPSGGCSWYLQPTPLEDPMYYCSTSNLMHPFGDYGTPSHNGGTWTIMSWSWVNRDSPFGRAMLARGDVFYPAAVSPIVIGSFVGGSGTCPTNRVANGWVKAQYGKVFTGTETIWGWVVVQSSYNGSPTRNHFTVRSAAGCPY